MKIRQAFPGEECAIMEVIESGRASLKAMGLPQWQNGYPDLHTIENDILNNEGWVAVEDSTIIGYAMLTLSGENTYDVISNGAGWITSCSSKEPGYITIHRIATKKEARGKGVAQAIIKQANTIAKEAGFSSIRIDTHAGNTPMRNFVTKLGFTTCGVIRINPGTNVEDERIAFERLLQ